MKFMFFLDTGYSPRCRDYAKIGAYGLEMRIREPKRLPETGMGLGYDRRGKQNLDGVCDRCGAVFVLRNLFCD